MAKRKRPDPAITARHQGALRPLAARLARQERAIEQTYREIGAGVRAAFADGVLVGDLKEVLGKSGSRIYQWKFELRDKARKVHEDALVHTQHAKGA